MTLADHLLAGTTPGSDQAGEQAAAAAVSVDPVLAAPVDVSALQVQQQLEPNMRLRNRFTSRRAAQALVGPSSNTLSEEAAAWIRRLGVHPDVLQSWGAGMAVVQHPDLKQGQVGWTCSWDCWGCSKAAIVQGAWPNKPSFQLPLVHNQGQSSAVTFFIEMVESTYVHCTSCQSC